MPQRESRELDDQVEASVTRALRARLAVINDELRRATSLPAGERSRRSSGRPLAAIEADLAQVLEALDGRRA